MSQNINLSDFIDLEAENNLKKLVSDFKFTANDLNKDKEPRFSMK